MKREKNVRITNAKMQMANVTTTTLSTHINNRFSVLFFRSFFIIIMMMMEKNAMKTQLLIEMQLTPRLESVDCCRKHK